MMSIPLCLYCLDELEIPTPWPPDPKCPSCKGALPALYLAKGIQSADGAPVRTDVVGCIGQRGNGTTTLLMSMIAAMREDPDSLLRQNGRDRLTDNADFYFGLYSASNDSPDFLEWASKAYLEFREKGTLPDATKVGGATPIPCYIEGHPSWGRRNLFLFDAAGESFRSTYRAARNAAFLARSRVLWVVVGMAEEDRVAGGEFGGRLWGLLDSCEGAMAEIRAKQGWQPVPQCLLVIFQKADARGAVLPELDEFLATEEATPEIRQAASDLLRDWMRAEDQLRGWGGAARTGGRFARVEFCAVSATGAETTRPQQLAVRPRPRRILDPLFWTWDLADYLEERDPATTASKQPRAGTATATTGRWFRPWSRTRRGDGASA